MRHAADGERDRSDVELAREDAPTELLHDILEGIAVLANHCSIVERESAIFVCIWVPKVVLDVMQRHPALHHLLDAASLHPNLLL